MQHRGVAVDARDDHHEIGAADHGFEALQASARGRTVVMLHAVPMNLRDRLESRGETVRTSHDGDRDHRKASLR